MWSVFRVRTNSAIPREISTRNGFSAFSIETVQASFNSFTDNILENFLLHSFKRIRKFITTDTCKCVLAAQTASEDSCNALQLQSLPRPDVHQVSLISLSDGPPGPPTDKCRPVDLFRWLQSFFNLFCAKNLSDYRKTVSSFIIWK